MRHSQHFCLLIHAQDHWDEKHKQKLLMEAIQEHSNLHGHSNCNTCMTCPICRSTWVLFDPMNPEEYVEVCEACEEIYKIFNKKRGKNSGIILFSHDNLKPEQIIPLVDIFLTKKIVKKLSIIQLEYQRHKEKTIETIKALKTKKVKKVEFKDILESGGFQFNIDYEVSKDLYF